MGHHACCAPQPSCVPAWCMPVILVPLPWPWPWPWPWPQTLVREIAVDAASPSAEGLIGGAGPVRLTLEYLVEPGAAAPELRIGVASGGAMTDWQATALTPGYRTLEPLGPVAAGSKVILKATDALARLRWCETVCC